MSLLFQRLGLFTAGLVLAFVFGLWCTPVLARDGLTFEPKNTAIIRTLDKVTARTATVAVPVGTAHRFGTLLVTVQACQQTPPEEQPESAAFIEIVDSPPERRAEVVFTGWMFASSPALSALQHPIYDVWVIGCKTVASASSAEGE